MSCDIYAEIGGSIIYKQLVLRKLRKRWCFILGEIPGVKRTSNTRKVVSMLYDIPTYWERLFPEEWCLALVGIPNVPGLTNTRKVMGFD